MDIVSLLETLVKGIFEAEEKFLNNPKDFYSLETAVKSTTEAFSAKFLGEILSSVNKQIYNCSWRQGNYKVHRNSKRTIITSVGDVTFDSTYYKRKTGEGGFVSLVEEMIGLEKNERFSEAAEVLLLTEALKTSYQEATRVLPSKQRISKTTVMNKVHQLAEEIEYKAPEEIKKVDYLYIEADEDHVAEQHGDNTENNKSFISKLVYVYENKQDVKGSKDKKELVNKFYFSGLYPGSDGNEKLWKNVQNYIDKTYDTESLKRVFISGDGAPWIKNGANILNNALFCADKYHLMKYINEAAAQMLDEKDIAKDELWHLLYSKKPKAKERFEAYMDQMMKSAKKPERIEKLKTYVLGNWGAVRRTLRNKLVNGCSAESHVSHVLSDRLSSRPMGWSQTGADRMSKLRCYERNYGRENIIELVRCSKKERKLKATGTDDVSVKKVSMREIMTDHYDQAKSYIERIQAHIPGLTAKKSIAIREQLGML